MRGSSRRRLAPKRSRYWGWCRTAPSQRKSSNSSGACFLQASGRCTVRLHPHFRREEQVRTKKREHDQPRQGALGDAARRGGQAENWLGVSQRRDGERALRLSQVPTSESAQGLGRQAVRFIFATAYDADAAGRKRRRRVHHSEDRGPQFDPDEFKICPPDSRRIDTTLADLQAYNERKEAELKAQSVQ